MQHFDLQINIKIYFNKNYQKIYLQSNWTSGRVIYYKWESLGIPVVNREMLRLPPDGFYDSDEETPEQYNTGSMSILTAKTVALKDGSVMGIDGLLENLTINQITVERGYESGHLVGDEMDYENISFPPKNAFNFGIDPSSGSEDKPIILYASRAKLIEFLVTKLDYKLMDDLLLSLDAFFKPLDFAQSICSVLYQAFMIHPNRRLPSHFQPDVVKMRCLVILQHWHSNVADSFNESLPEDVSSYIIQSLEAIIQKASLSPSERGLLSKVLRIYDPDGRRNSFTTTSDLSLHLNQHDFNTSTLITSDSASTFSAFDSASQDPTSKQWRARLKAKLKSIFGRSNSSEQSGSPASLLVNSFSSDLEDRDDEACQLLLGERSRNLALIFSVVESDLLVSIERSEIVCFAQVRELPLKLAESCPNLQRAIDHFNSMCRWFVHVITSQIDILTASHLLAKLIRLAVKCTLINNYNTFLQIVLALQSPSLSNLTAIWDELPTWERKLARDLTIFGSPARNFKNIRRAMEEVFDEELDASGPPPIPFTGLFLSDSVYNWEQADAQLRNHPPTEEKPLAVYKCHVIAKILRQFRQYKQAASKSSLKLTNRQRQLYSYFADIGRLGGDFLEENY